MFISLFGWFETLTNLLLRRKIFICLYPSLVDSKPDTSPSGKKSVPCLYPSLVDSKRQGMSSRDISAKSLYPSLVDSKLGPSIFIVAGLRLYPSLVDSKRGIYLYGPGNITSLYPSLVDSKLKCVTHCVYRFVQVYIPLWLIRNAIQYYVWVVPHVVFISLFGWFETVSATRHEWWDDGLYPSLVDSKQNWPRGPESAQTFISLFGWFETCSSPPKCRRKKRRFISLFGWFET